MTFGRIAFSPSNYNPRIPAPQRVTGLGDNTARMDGQQSPVHNPPHPSPTRLCNALTRTHARSRDRPRPGSPGPGAAELRWHLLHRFSAKNGAHPPLWGSATPAVRQFGGDL